VANGKRRDEREPDQKPAVLIVGADKGGVGKTTISRTLLDYMAARNMLAEAVPPEPH
jgi:predicted GTPase